MLNGRAVLFIIFFAPSGVYLYMAYLHTWHVVKSQIPGFSEEGQAYGGLSGMDQARQRIPEMQQQSNFKQWPSAMQTMLFPQKQRQKAEGPKRNCFCSFESFCSLALLHACASGQDPSSPTKLPCNERGSRMKLTN